jgi:hypothetical protein
MVQVQLLRRLEVLRVNGHHLNPRKHRQIPPAGRARWPRGDRREMTIPRSALRPRVISPRPGPKDNSRSRTGGEFLHCHNCSSDSIASTGSGGNSAFMSTTLNLSALLTTLLMIQFLALVLAVAATLQQMQQFRGDLRL